MRCPAGVGRWYVAERVGWHWAGLGKAICRWSPGISQRGAVECASAGRRTWAPGFQHRIEYQDILSVACM